MGRDSAVEDVASLIAIARTGGGSGLDVTAVFVAPWFEEAAKGAAVLLVLVFRRREFDGVVDGIVLAGLSGVGFAFTENILYLASAYDGSDNLQAIQVAPGLHEGELAFLHDREWARSADDKK